MYYQQTYNPVNSIIIKKSTHSTISAALSNHSNHIYIFSGSLKTVAHTSTSHQSHHILGFKEIYRTLGQKEYMRLYIDCLSPHCHIIVTCNWVLRDKFVVFILSSQLWTKNFLSVCKI